MNQQEIRDAARGLVGHIGWDAYQWFLNRRLDEARTVCVTDPDTDNVRFNQGRYEALQSMVGWLDRVLKEEA